MLRDDNGVVSVLRVSGDSSHGDLNNTFAKRLERYLFRSSGQRGPFLLVAAVGFPLQSLAPSNPNTNLVPSQASQSFANIGIGSQYTLSESILNNGTNAVSLGVQSYFQQPGIPNNWDFAISWPNGNTISPGQSLPLNITYTPVVPTNVVALFNLQDNNKKTLSLSVSGAGINTFSLVTNAVSYLTGYNVYSDHSKYVLPPVASLSGPSLPAAGPGNAYIDPDPTNMVFGNITVGNTYTLSSIINNQSGSDITITSVSLLQSSLASNPCFSTSGLINGLPKTIHNNQSLTFFETFAPVVPGTAVGRLTINLQSGGPLIQSIYGNGVAGKSVSLQWPLTADPSAYHVNVYRSGKSGGPYSLETSLSPSTTAYLDSSVVAGQTYYYVIQLVDSFGPGSGYTYSPYSNEASITPQ